MPATQNDIATCFDCLKKDMFCCFPHRLREATVKPEIRDETCWSLKTSISCKTSSNFHTLYSFKIDTFLRVFTMKRKIDDLKIYVLSKLLSIFNISQNVSKCDACHEICTLSPLHAALTLRFAENTQRDATRPATQNDDGGLQSAAPATENATHPLKRTQKYYDC